MSSERAVTLILPGINNSGPAHWQSLWELRDPAMRRVVQHEWDAPARADWVNTLNHAIDNEKQHVVLVAHSSACAMVAHWVVQASPAQRARVRGALLVAPSNPEGPSYPVGPSGFGPVPRIALTFPSIVVSSDDDVYVSESTAREYARAWNSSFVLLPGAGHINAASGHGEWPEGLALLESLHRAP